MAYQTRGRDPLLDTNMAEAIEKRGKELLGLGLIAASALDPAWLCARTHLAFADVFALSTLYHLASWWSLTLDKSRLPTGAPGLGKDIAVVHAIPADSYTHQTLPTNREV